MYRLCASLQCRVDDTLLLQVGVSRGRAADVYGLICLSDMQCIDIGIGVDGDSANPQSGCGVYYPAGDLSSVCNQYLVKHVRLLTS